MKKRKQLLFGFIVAVLGIITVEACLHIAHFVVLGVQKKEKSKDSEYMISLSKEDKEASMGIDWTLLNTLQYLKWRREEYAGKYVNINSQGIRKTWLPAGAPKRFTETIYIFGGSPLWGIGAGDDYTIPSYFSKLLNNNEYNYLVYNYGESGYTFTREVINLILLLREGHRPDYVIFYDGANDVDAAYQSAIPGGTFHLVSRKLERIKQNDILMDIYFFWRDLTDLVKRHSMIYRVSKEKISIYLPRRQRYSNKELHSLADGIIEYYVKSKSLLDHLSIAYGFKYICFWQPVLFSKKNLTNEEIKIYQKQKGNQLSRLYIIVNGILAEKPLTNFFNISNILDNTLKRYYFDFCHLSEEGNEAVAKEMYRVFKKEFLSDTR